MHQLQLFFIITTFFIFLTNFLRLPRLCGIASATLVNMAFLQKLKVPHLAVRGIQGFFALVILALSSYGEHHPPGNLRSHTSGSGNIKELTWTEVAHWYNTDTLTASPSQINIMIFSGVWSIISIIQLEVVSKFVPRCTSQGTQQVGK